MFEELQNVLKALDLNTNDVRWQWYDNWSNKRGRHQGIQKRLLNINLRAMYTPFGCHILNITLFYMVNSYGKVKDFFGTVQCLYNLFTNSTNQWFSKRKHKRTDTQIIVSHTMGKPYCKC